MIPINEVRYGNLVINDCNDKVQKMAAVDFVTLKADEEWLNPILLAPEILEAIGFTGWRRQVSMNMGYEAGDIFFAIPNGFVTHRGNTIRQPIYKHDFVISLVLGKRMAKDSYEGTFWYGRGGTKRGTEIKTLHQLQNLYFALNGEELPVTVEQIQPIVENLLKQQTNNEQP